jgi:hypothetical protein
MKAELIVRSPPRVHGGCSDSQALRADESTICLSLSTIEFSLGVTTTELLSPWMYDGRHRPFVARTTAFLRRAAVLVGDAAAEPQLGRIWAAWRVC